MEQRGSSGMMPGNRYWTAMPLIFALLLGLPAPQAIAEEPEGAGETQVAMPLALAKAIANVFYECAERNHKPRSIHIIDSSGVTVYAARMDGQIADNIEVALLKARSALYFRESTEHRRELDLENPLHAHQTTSLGQFTSPVGLPIIVNGELVGALGMGGASGDCAREALAEVVGAEGRPRDILSGPEDPGRMEND